MRYTYSPAEDAELQMIMAQARANAWAFGISQALKAYLEQFAPEKRMQHILAISAELENQFELCNRLLCIESGVHGTDRTAENQSGNLSNRSISDFL
jgi:hypothetical protein